MARKYLSLSENPCSNPGRNEFPKKVSMMSTKKFEFEFPDTPIYS